MTDNTQKAQGSGAVELIERLRDVYGALTPGAIDRADLDGMAFAVQDAISFLSQPPEASEPKPWYETDAHRDLSRIIPDMEGKIAEAKIRFGHCLPANLFAPLEGSITELRVLRHELAAIPAAEASEVEAEREQLYGMIRDLGLTEDQEMMFRGRVRCHLAIRDAAHPPKASPMRELQAMGQEFDAGVEASAALTGEMLKAALLEEGGDAYMRNEDTPSHFLIDGIVDLDAVARSLAQPAPDPGYIIVPDESYFDSTAPEQE